jgi:intraflagellar transport protein 122
MFTELGMWDFATSIAQESQGDVGTILKKKAKVHQDANNLQAAAQTYMEVGDHWQAVEILGPNGWHEKLIEIVRSVNKTETKILSQCVHYFRKQNHHAYATETLVKMGDISHLLELHIDLQHWEDAFQLAEMHPEFNERIYLPYARWLAMNDRFVEAQEHFRKAGRTDESIQVLTQLSENAVEERRYDDGGYFYWLLGREHLNSIPVEKDMTELTPSEKAGLAKYHEYHSMSEVYYVYHFVKRFLEEPFTSHLPESLLNMERFLLHYSVTHKLPRFVSLLHVLFAITKHADALGAVKLGRYAYDRLLQMQLPPVWQESMESGALTVRGKPFHDKDDLLPLCYKCSSVNPLFSPKGNRCVNCQEAFTFSFYSLENLPLVRFTLDSGITDEEALELINAEPPSDITGGAKSSKWQESKRKNVQQLTLTEGSRATSLHNLQDQQKRQEETDNFTKLLTTLEAQSQYQPVVVSRAILLSLHRNEVFIRRHKHKCLPNEYYKNILPDIPITMCAHCNKFFHSDNYEFLVLQNQSCPFCRTHVDINL